MCRCVTVCAPVRPSVTDTRSLDHVIICSSDFKNRCQIQSSDRGEGTGLMAGERDAGLEDKEECEALRGSDI